MPNSKQQREQRIKDRRCVQCGEELEENRFRTLCVICARLSVLYVMKRYTTANSRAQKEKLRLQRIEARQCTRCGEPLGESETHKRCSICRFLARDAYISVRGKSV